MKISFIGLGNMGLPMAVNLSKAGHDVVGYDASEAIRQSAVEKGLTVASNNAETAQNCDVVVTMLPNGQIVKSVTDELFSNLNAGSLLIDCSTIDIDSSRAIHAIAKKSGVLSLDAPVSGGVGGAQAGTLTFMVGGDLEALSKGQELLDIMGQKAIHCGDAGAGQAAKICNNMLLGISMIGTCEAFALADKLGLDQQKLYELVSISSGSCWSVNTYCPVPNVGPKSPADNDYKLGFASALMGKDLNLAMDAANSVDSPTPLGAHAAELYKRVVDLGHGDMDFSAIINLFTELEAAKKAGQ